jgi:histidine triad (HIT) family protein
MPSSCLFCRIASGQVQAAVVFEDSELLAFLDHRPLFPGHTLVIPRQHYATMMDCPFEAASVLFRLATRLCMAMEDGLQAAGSFVAVNNRVSQSVPHLHIHVVPRRPKDGLRGFFWPRSRYRDDAEMESVRAALHSSLVKLSQVRGGGSAEGSAG